MLAVGDWNDLDAAIEVAAGKSQVGVLGEVGASEQGTGSRSRARTFDVTTLGGASGKLRARLTMGGDRLGGPPGPESIELSAQIGVFGEAETEERFLRAIKRRLEQLSGVDTAPAR